jgi:hypothetical protein
MGRWREAVPPAAYTTTRLSLKDWVIRLNFHSRAAWGVYKLQYENRRDGKSEHNPLLIPAHSMPWAGCQPRTTRYI